MKCKHVIFVGLLGVLLACNLPQRSHEKIYAAMFGKPGDSCVEMLQSRDAIALDDGMIYIHFKACPNEVKRILALVPYKFEGMSTSSMKIESIDTTANDADMIPYRPNWWRLNSLGDSCLKYEYIHKDEDRAQVLFISIDSTEVFYKDLVW